MSVMGAVGLFLYGMIPALLIIWACHSLIKLAEIELGKSNEDDAE